MVSSFSLLVSACGAAGASHAAPAPSLRSPDERESSEQPEQRPRGAPEPHAASPHLPELRDGEVVATWEGTFGAGRDLSLSLVLERGECYRVRVAAPGGALFGTLDDEHGHRVASARGEGVVDLGATGLCPRWTGSFSLEVDGPGALRHARVELVRLPDAASSLSPRLPSAPSDEAEPEAASDP